MSVFEISKTNTSDVQKYGRLKEARGNKFVLMDSFLCLFVSCGDLSVEK